jgi:3-phenylpropionate/trans-cinnamate dioxygenase ferredoxin reductase component
MLGTERIVVVGASLAGVTAATALREEGFSGELMVIGQERHAPYDRPPLSKEFLAGVLPREGLALEVTADLDTLWKLGVTARSLDLQRREIETSAGALGFDRLVIATGARPRELPGLPLGLRVHTLRTLDDSLRLREGLLTGGHVLLIGAGWIGVEVATTARSLGCEVTIVSPDPPVAVAGPEVSEVCTARLKDLGVRLHVGCTVADIEMGSHGGRARLSDGVELGFDLSLVAIGATPNTEWLQGSGLTVDDGVVCDPSLAAVGTDGVVAAGDVVRWSSVLFDRSMRIEHWANAIEQGVAAARTLLHGTGADTAFRAVPDFWSDHCGMRLQAVGLLGAAARFEVVDGSLDERRFALVGRDAGGDIVGAVAYGMPRTIARYRGEMAAKAAA